MKNVQRLFAIEEELLCVLLTDYRNANCIVTRQRATRKFVVDHHTESPSSAAAAAPSATSRRHCCVITFTLQTIESSFAVPGTFACHQ